MLKASSPSRLRYPAALRATALPYGFTITVWSSGAVIMHAHGTPNVGDVFLFLAGALLAYAAVALLARRPSSEALEPSDGDLAVAGILQAVVVGASVGAAALIALLHSQVAWLLGSFAATALWFAAGALDLALAHARGRAG